MRPAWKQGDYTTVAARDGLARVIQTLKTGRLATALGTVIEFEHEGGELEVNAVIVRSDARGARTGNRD